MIIHNGVQLRDDEYEELLALAEAADNGEDVMLAAFMRLCPTGQEGAFDEAVVAAYAALAEAGFIEGVQEGGEFFFEDITPAGRALTNPRFAAQAGSPHTQPESNADPIEVQAEDAETDSELLHSFENAAHDFGMSEEPQKSSEQPTSEPAAPAESAQPHERPLAGLFSNPATTQAVVAGAVAGFIAGAIAACIITIVL